MPSGEEGASFDDLELLKRRVATLFVTDGDGALVRQNEFDGGPPPRLYLGRTADGAVCRFRSGLSARYIDPIRRLVAREPTGQLTPYPRYARQLTELLSEDGPPSVWAGPAYRFGSLPEVSGLLVVTPEHADLLVEGFSDLIPELHLIQPCIVKRVRGSVVSACWSSRRSADFAEAGVHTLPDHWNRGYASAACAGWANAVRAAGLAPLYSTSWDNAASRALAARLGLSQYGVDYSLM